MRIYADESCTRANQGLYMVIGGIICDKETVKLIRKEINQLKKDENLPSDFEFHFSQMKVDNVELYKKLIDIFFKFYFEKCDIKRGINEQRFYRKICFEALLIEHNKIDHNLYSAGNSELGFFRFYYQLLFYSVKKHYVKGKQFHITIDRINTTDKKIVHDLQSRLFNELIDITPNPIQNLQKQDSKAELMLQMADVILGLVSFSWNKLPGESSTRLDAKRSVVEYAIDKHKVDYSKTTYKTCSFNIWNLQLH
jgi:hypothetical protein